MRYLRMGIVFIIASTLSAAPQAATLKPSIVNLATLKWFDASNLPAGAKLAILSGNPKKKEFYAAFLKLPAHFTIPAHSHISNEYNTVISGTYYLGDGDSMDIKATTALPAGSFVIFPAGAKHYGFTKEETILEVSGIGPWGTIPQRL